MTLHGVTARRWSLASIVLLLLVSSPWAKAQTPNPAGPASPPSLSRKPCPVGTRWSGVAEEPEKTPPRSVTESTLDRNSRRAGSLQPGKDARFSYWAQDQERVGLLVFPSTLQVQIRPESSWKSAADEEVPGSRLRRITFLEAGRLELVLRNRGSAEVEYSLLLISLSDEGLQRIEYGPGLQGQIETAGDVDVYAIDVGDSVELGLLFKFMASSNDGIAFILSPQNGLKYYGMPRGRSLQKIGLNTEKPESLLLVISADQSGACYRLLLDQKALRVFRLPPAGESETRDYLLRPNDVVSIPLRHEGREGWKVQVKKIGEPFQLEGSLGPAPTAIVAGPHQKVASLELIQREVATLTLKNVDSHIGKLEVTLTAASRSCLDIPHIALLVGCVLATLLFLPTQLPATGPFNHLHFPSNHYGYCFIVGLTSFGFLAVLLWLGRPFLSELQELSGVKLEYLAKASGFTGFFITLYWIHSLVKSRQEIHRKIDKGTSTEGDNEKQSQEVGEANEHPKEQTEEPAS